MSGMVDDSVNIMVGSPINMEVDDIIDIVHGVISMAASELIRGLEA